METSIKKEPIVSGSFNHNLTQEEAKAFPREQKLTMCWFLIVSFNHAHSFKNIENEVFYQTENLWSHKELEEIEDIDSILVCLMEAYQDKHYDLLQRSEVYGIEKGRNIAKAQKELSFGGFIEMNYSRAMGYVMEGGSWNDFDSNNVSSMIKKIEGLAPRREYGPNNCNTGLIKHKWTLTGEYLTLKYDYINSNELQPILDFYKSTWEIEGQKVKADSIRYEKEDFDGRAHSIELIMWWD